MKENDEILIHRKTKSLEGTYPIATPWGTLVVKLDAVPNYAGGKGCPDEILCVKVEFAAFGADVTVSAPVLIEGEKSGIDGAKLDLKKFCERTVSGEQRSYLKIPVVVVGGAIPKRPKTTTKQLLAQFNTVQVPKRVICD